MTGIVRRIIFGLGVILFVWYALAPLLAQLVDRLLNRVMHSPPYDVRPDTAVFHNQLFIADLHSDPYLWHRNLRKQHTYGHIDVPRLIEGNVALQTIGVATKTPWGLNFDSNPDGYDMLTTLIILQGWPLRTWQSLYQRALYHAQRLHNLIAQSPDELLLIRSADDLDTLLARRQQNSRTLGFLLGLEGVHALEGDLSRLDELCDAGFRLLGLAHFIDNDAGGSAHGLQKGGLTPFGAELVRVAEAKKMIIDLAHASPQLIEDVCAVAQRPLLVSHTGVCGTCDTPRNLHDRHLKMVAASGGLIGIALFETAVGEPTIPAVVRAMRYVADLVGVEHVALGSDFDGAITAPIDASGLPLLTEALLEADFTPEDVYKIMGGNALHFLRDALP